jgi:hypothetical protein
LSGKAGAVLGQGWLLGDQDPSCFLPFSKRSSQTFISIMVIVAVLVLLFAVLAAVVMWKKSSDGKAVWS